MSSDDINYAKGDSDLSLQDAFKLAEGQRSMLHTRIHESLHVISASLVESGEVGKRRGYPASVVLQETHASDFLSNKTHPLFILGAPEIIWKLTNLKGLEGMALKKQDEYSKYYISESGQLVIRTEVEVTIPISVQHHGKKPKHHTKGSVRLFRPARLKNITLKRVDKLDEVLSIVRSAEMVMP